MLEQKQYEIGNESLFTFGRKSFGSTSMKAERNVQKQTNKQKYINKTRNRMFRDGTIVQRVKHLSCQPELGPQHPIKFPGSY